VLEDLPRQTPEAGERQTIESLINEEALLFARYLRGEVLTWKPRMWPSMN